MEQDILNEFSTFSIKEFVDHSQASLHHVKTSSGVLTPVWKQEKEPVSWWKLDPWSLIKRRCCYLISRYSLHFNLHMKSGSDQLCWHVGFHLLRAAR